jgi:hypothetical protein
MRPEDPAPDRAEQKILLMVNDEDRVSFCDHF